MFEPMANLPTKEQVAAVQADVTDIKTNVQTLVDRASTITVTLATQDGVTPTGQTVYLYAGASSSAPIYASLAYDGQPVTFEVPRGFRYFIMASSTLSGHFAPSTATGVVSTATVAVTLTYSDISHITTYAELAGAVQSITNIAEGRAALVGIEIADTWTLDDGTTSYSDPMVVNDVKEVEDAEGAKHIAAICVRKYTTHNAIQFDAPERLACDSETETTAAGNGVFYWGYGAKYDSTKTYAVNAYCSYDGNIYKCTTAVSSAEAFDSTKWQEQTSFQTGALVYLSLNAGATIPYSSYQTVYKTDVSTSNKDMFWAGYNNYQHSAIRQYLNSSAGIGEWWHSQHVGDCPPAQLSLTRGYKAGCSAALLAAAKPIKVYCYANSSTDASRIYAVADQFWLPSGTEMFGAANENEGVPFAYVESACKSATGWTAAQNGNNAGRVYRKMSATTSAQTLWLRSAHRGNSYIAWNVNTLGFIISGNDASSAYGALPACAIY